MYKNFVLFALLAFASCTKIADNPAAENLPTATWTMYEFLEDSNVLRGNYDSYVFTFNADGSATAVKGSTTVNGTWADAKKSEAEIILNFDDTNQFEKLDGTWGVHEQYPNRVSLKKTVGTVISYLIFEKI